MQLRFEPLTKERLYEAVEITNAVFPDEKVLIHEVYEASLGFPERQSYWEKSRILEYWIVTDSLSNKIVALTGFYQDYEHSSDEIWLGWYCVVPTERGKGIGRKTLAWTIQEASNRGYKYFRLWTTNHPTEAAAQKLYESLGLKIYKQEKNSETGELILYRELKL